MRQDTILVVDDELSVCVVIAAVLEEEGFKVLQAHNGVEAMRMFFDYRPDLVILDIIMPLKDGRDTGKQLREVSDVPIIMLTTLSDEKEKVERLDDGADDYVPKPFNNNELVARVRALLRRTRQYKLPLERIFDDGYLRIDFDSHVAQVYGKVIKLTPKEWLLLEFLVKNKNKVLQRSTLLKHIWGSGFEDADNIIKVAISNLRVKLGDRSHRPRYIQTERRIGYRFETHA